MLGQQKKYTIPVWSIILMACLLLLVTVPFIWRMTGVDFNESLLDQGLHTQEGARPLAQPSIEILRATRPDFAGGYVPESTMSDPAVSVQVLRAAKPNFDGGFVPDSSMGGQEVSVEVLLAAKPDFTGGFVPDPAMENPAVSVDVLRAAKPNFEGGFVPDSSMGD